MEFYVPVRLLCGSEVVFRNAERLQAFGKRCLIVTGGSAAKRSGAFGDAIRALDSQGIAHTVYDKIQPNPTVASCLEAAELGRDFGASFVLGIGGGSALDASKAIAAFLTNPGLDEAGLYGLQWKKAAPIVLIGTTSGTGSEVTAVAVLTNCEGRKKSVKRDDLFASLALGDARYTETMPLSVTATTAVDALSHCIESFCAKNASDLSRAYAIRGIRLLLPALEGIRAGQVPDAAQRETLYHASILGGFAIAMTGTAAPHSLGYLLSEQFNVPHGFACGYFLPAFLRQVSSADPALAAFFYDAIGTDEAALTDQIAGLLPTQDFTLTDAQMRALLPRWTMQVANIAKTPGVCDEQVIEGFLRSVFTITES